MFKDTYARKYLGIKCHVDSNTLKVYSKQEGREGGRVKEKSKGSRREKKTGAWDQNIQRYCSNRYMWAWSLRAGDKSLKECSGTLKGPRPIRDGSRCQQVYGDSFFDFLVKATRDL